jgi:hypothetical protein
MKHITRVASLHFLSKINSYFSPTNMLTEAREGADESKLREDREQAEVGLD